MTATDLARIEGRLIACERLQQLLLLNISCIGQIEPLDRLSTLERGFFDDMQRVERANDPTELDAWTAAALREAFGVVRLWLEMYYAATLSDPRHDPIG